MPSPSWRLFLAAAIAGAPISARAQEELIPDGVTDIEQLDIEVLLGTVTAASRSRESVVKAPATVTVLDRRRIRAAGARDIPELLRRVPGVEVMKNSHGAQVVSLRGTAGLQGNNLLVLLDGVAINNLIDGTVNWIGIPVHLNQIVRIEIVRGPVSTIYGANAFTGVINIVTAHDDKPDSAAIFELGADAGFEHGATASSFGSVRGQAGGFLYSFNGSVRYRGQGEAEGVSAAGLEQISGALAAERSIGERASVSLRASASRTQLTSLDYLVLSPELLEENDVLGVGVLKIAGDDHDLLDAFELHGTARWHSTPGLSDSPGAVDSAGSSFTYRGVQAMRFATGADLRLRPAPGYRLVIGASAGVSAVDAWFLHPRENEETRADYGAYVTGSADILESVALSFGARVEDSAMTRAPKLSGRASAIWYTNELSLRLSAATAYRHPTQVEAGSRLVDARSGLIVLEGNPNLDAPEVSSIEAAAIWAVVPELRIKPTIYLARAGHLVVTDFEPLVRKTFATDNVHRLMLGGELELEWQLMPELELGLSSSALHFLVDGENGTSAEQSSKLTAWLEVRGTVLENRMGYGVAGGYSSPRRYATRTGVPPQLVLAELPAAAHLEASLDFRIFREEPFWIWARVSSHLPDGARESPLPNATVLGTSAFLGFDYRRE